MHSFALKWFFLKQLRNVLRNFLYFLSLSEKVKLCFFSLPNIKNIFNFSSAQFFFLSLTLNLIFSSSEEDRCWPKDVLRTYGKQMKTRKTSCFLYRGWIPHNWSSLIWCRYLCIYICVCHPKESWWIDSNMTQLYDRLVISRKKDYNLIIFVNVQNFHFI